MSKWVLHDWNMQIISGKKERKKLIDLFLDIHVCREMKEKKWCNTYIEEVCYWKIIIDSRGMFYVHIDIQTSGGIIHLQNWSSNVIGLRLLWTTNISSSLSLMLHSKHHNSPLVFNTRDLFLSFVLFFSTKEIY